MIICQLNYTEYEIVLLVDSKILKKEYKKDFRYLNANQIQEKIFQWLFNI